MRVLGILFIFLNLLTSLIFFAEKAPIVSPSFALTEHGLITSDLSIQQSSIVNLGEALPANFVPERPVFRTISYFEAQFLLVNFAELSENCQSKGNNYQKLAKTIDPNFPAFLIAFPHHHFT